MCEEKQRLLEVYETTETAHSERLTTLTRQAGTVSRADYEALKKALDQARMESERARIALDAHVSSHSC
jgi:RNase P subunit RPR2